MSEDIPKYLRRAKAAEYVVAKWGIPCSQRWLAKLAVTGGGPTFHKAGRFPMYAPEALDDWAQGRIGAGQESTSNKFSWFANAKPRP